MTLAELTYSDIREVADYLETTCDNLDSSEIKAVLINIIRNLPRQGGAA